MIGNDALNACLLQYSWVVYPSELKDLRLFDGIITHGDLFLNVDTLCLVGMNEFVASYSSVFGNNELTNQSFYKHVKVRPAGVGKEIARGSVATCAVRRTVTAINCAKRVISFKIIYAPGVPWASHFDSELRAACNLLLFTRKSPSTEASVYRTIFAMEVGIFLYVFICLSKCGGVNHNICTVTCF